MNIKKFFSKILDSLYPEHLKCIFCDEELNEISENDTCDKCYQFLPFIKNPCNKCGGEMGENSSGVCLTCKSHIFDFENAIAVFKYSNQIVTGIHNFKYNGMKFLSKPFASFMTEKLATFDINYDIITFVPMSDKKLKIRKYNQAELLARDIAKLVDAPVANLLEKVSEKQTQTKLNFKERQENVKDTFKVKKDYKSVVKGNDILIIDDVFTTGATTNEIAKTLKNAGANSVYVLTLAHTEIKTEI